MLTNNFDLPEPIVKAIQNDDYDSEGADITASSLWSPPRIRVLRKQHASDIHHDTADGIYALIGKAVHNILERSGDTAALSELRLKMLIHGWILSGKFDRFVLAASKLSDWKITSVYSILGDTKPEWIGQLNTYAHLLRHHHIPVEGLEVVAILRDWSKREARRNPDYPQKQAVCVPIPLWTPAEAEQRISDRILLHQGAEKSLPLCTPEERWLRPAKWAALKSGATRATKLFDTQEAAELWLSAQKDSRKFEIQERPAEAVRCLDYCDAASFCAQWQSDPNNNSARYKEFIS